MPTTYYTKSGEPIEKLAYDLGDTMILSSCGRNKILEAVESGELVAHRNGVKLLFIRSDILKWLHALPTTVATKQSGRLAEKHEDEMAEIRAAVQGG